MRWRDSRCCMTNSGLTGTLRSALSWRESCTDLREYLLACPVLCSRTSNPTHSSRMTRMGMTTRIRLTRNNLTTMIMRLATMISKSLTISSNNSHRPPKPRWEGARPSMLHPKPTPKPCLSTTKPTPLARREDKPTRWASDQCFLTELASPSESTRRGGLTFTECLITYSNLSCTFRL